VKIRIWLAGGVIAALTVTACASGPSVRASVIKGSPFCNDLSTFAGQLVVLSNEADAPLATLQQAVPPIHAQLLKLAQEAPAADTVNGHSVKADLMTVANVYGDLATALTTASPNGPNAVGDVLAAEEAKDGAALTQAVGRLDPYTKDACGVAVVSPSPSTTTLPAATPTTAVIGPAPVGASAAATTTTLPPAAATTTTTVAGPATNVITVTTAPATTG